MSGLAFPKPTRKTRPPRRLRRRQTLAAVRAERKADSPGVSPEMWEAILRWYDWTCAFCGEPEKLNDRLVQDHLTPLAKGGGHLPENLVPAHSSCNTTKGTSTRWKPLRMHPFRSDVAGELAG